MTYRDQSLHLIADIDHHEAMAENLDRAAKQWRNRILGRSSVLAALADMHRSHASELEAELRRTA